MESLENEVSELQKQRDTVSQRKKGVESEVEALKSQLEKEQKGT